LSIVPIQIVNRRVFGSNHHPCRHR